VFVATVALALCIATVALALCICPPVPSSVTYGGQGNDENEQEN